LEKYFKLINKKFKIINAKNAQVHYLLFKKKVRFVDNMNKNPASIWFNKVLFYDELTNYLTISLCAEVFSMNS